MGSGFCIRRSQKETAATTCDRRPGSTRRGEPSSWLRWRLQTFVCGGARRAALTTPHRRSTVLAWWEQQPEAGDKQRVWLRRQWILHRQKRMRPAYTSCSSTQDLTQDLSRWPWVDGSDVLCGRGEGVCVLANSGLDGRRIWCQDDRGWATNAARGGLFLWKCLGLPPSSCVAQIHARPSTAMAAAGNCKPLHPQCVASTQAIASPTCCIFQGHSSRGPSRSSRFATGFGIVCQIV